MSPRRSARAAQAAAKRRSAPSTSTQATTQSSSRVSKGRGAVSVATATPGRDQGAAEVAAVMALPGSSEVGLTTAQHNQLTLYESDDGVLRAPQSGNLLGHGPSVAHQVTVKVPRYVDNPRWERYQQAVEFHMESWRRYSQETHLISLPQTRPTQH